MLDYHAQHVFIFVKYVFGFYNLNGNKLSPWFVWRWSIQMRAFLFFDRKFSTEFDVLFSKAKLVEQENSVIFFDQLVCTRTLTQLLSVLREKKRLCAFPVYWPSFNCKCSPIYHNCSNSNHTLKRIWRMKRRPEKRQNTWKTKWPSSWMCCCVRYCSKIHSTVSEFHAITWNLKKKQHFFLSFSVSIFVSEHCI